MASQFSIDLSKYAIETPEKMNRIVRKIMLDVFKGVILKTPVDTGRARANWQATIGGPSSGTLDSEDKTGQMAISGGSKAIAAMKEFSPVFLYNGLPYIGRLENGWSGQAPAGMVKITLAEYPGIVSSATQEENW